MTVGMGTEIEHCRDCWYWSDEVTMVCTNGDSPHWAGHVEGDDYCPCYQRKWTLEAMRREDGQGGDSK